MSVIEEPLKQQIKEVNKKKKVNCLVLLYIKENKLLTSYELERGESTLYIIEITY